MKKKAFTLIELLVVISVVGILSTVVVGKISKTRSVAKDNALLGTIKNLQTGLELYYIDNGEYPPGTYNSYFPSSHNLSLSGLADATGVDVDSISPCIGGGVCERRYFYRSLRTGTQGSRNLTASQSSCWKNHYYIFVELDNPVTDLQPIQEFPCGGAGSFGDSDGSDFCPIFYPIDSFPDEYAQCVDDMVSQSRENYVYLAK